MEKSSGGYHWWLTNHNNHHQSPWLKATLTDLDEKTKSIVSLIVQEDGETFAQRAEMYYKNKTELLNKVEEFHRSYRSLAERYDQLKSESARVSRSGPPSSNSFNHIENLPNRESNISISDSNPNPKVEEITKENSKVGFEHENSNGVEVGGVDVLVNDEKQEEQFEMGSSEREDFWSCGSAEMNFEISKLIEDNQNQQSELIRRNNEKRKTIKDLSLKLEKLFEEMKDRRPSFRSRSMTESLIIREPIRSQKSKGLIIKEPIQSQKSKGLIIKEPIQSQKSKGLVITEPIQSRKSKGKGGLNFAKILGCSQ